MGAVSPIELVRLWEQEQLPTERAVGQMLQQLVTMQATLERQAHTITDLRTQIIVLSTQSSSNAVGQTPQGQRKTKR